MDGLRESLSVPPDIQHLTNPREFVCRGLQAAFTDYADGACPVPTEMIDAQGQKYLTLTRWTSLDDKFVLAGPAIVDSSSQNVTVSIPTLAAAGSSASSSAAPASTAAASATAAAMSSAMSAMPSASASA